MKFEFAKYTEITELAFSINPSYKEQGYVRFFICPDVWDFWFVRILKGWNEDYEEDENSFLLERDKVGMDRKGQSLNINTVRKLINEDSGENWDLQQSDDINELIGMLDAGFGIHNLQEAK